MVKQSQYVTYWRIIALVAALAWMLVFVNTLHTLSSGYEKTAGELLVPYVLVGLQGGTIIACMALVIFPLQFSIYVVLCCLWGLLHIIEGGSFGGILMYGLGLLFALKEGFFHAHKGIKLSFAILLLAGAVLSQIRYGSEYLIATLFDTVAVCLMAGIGVFLYSREIQKQVPNRNIHADMVTANGQEKILLLHQARFNQRDIEILQSILRGNKYECIAGEQDISLSSVKKRVRILFDYINLPDRASFVTLYADYAIELGISVSQSGPTDNITQFPSPQTGSDL
jgi:DNA-binding CsgD family transcriptional regulator